MNQLQYFIYLIIVILSSICKGKPHLSKVPFIIVTAELGEEIRREAIEAHASHFLNKPTNANDIKMALKQLLQINESI
jgi:CheY-like chemotaxis protein